MNTLTTPSGKVIQHGKLSTYNHYKCRCDPCKDAMRKYIRNYQKRIRKEGKPSSRRRTAPLNRQLPNGRFIDQAGYICVVQKNRPPIGEHRLIMEEILGRPLKKGETVHHRNGQKSDNRRKNLQLRVSKHPVGQEIPDLINWAVEILSEYRDIPTSVY